MKPRNNFRFPRAARVRIALVLGVLVSLATPGSASAQLAPMYNQLVNTVQQQVMNQLMAKMGVGVEGAVTQSGAAVQGEVLKSAATQKSVAEGLEAYRQQQKVQRDAQTTMESLQQPATTCQTMAAQGSLGNVTQSARASVATSQTRVLKKVGGTTNTMQAVEQSYQATNSTLCTREEAARGICKVNPQSQDLAGADQNAAFLFQGKDGSTTYAGGPNGPQTTAADGYIARVVAATPAAQLRNVDYSKSPASRAYIELQRRYTAVLSMAAYSLNQVKAAHTPVVGLGNDTMMSNAQGFPAKADMSMQEAVQRFVATKFSPNSMADAAKATNVNLILRDMAQMNAFQLWIDQQTLLQDTRTEALMAHQLALLTEQTLRPGLEAQRKLATAAGRQ